MAHETPTFCRICEAECGLIATVADGRVVDVRADHDNPHSMGFMCTKPKAMIQITDDPDRLTQPLRRVGGPGEFEPVTWDEALTDITARLTSITRLHGKASFATYSGNPGALDNCGSAMLDGLRTAIGSKWSYGAGGDDSASYTAALWHQFGAATLFLRPDVWRTDFFLVLGANPWISKGSVISEPQLRRAMQGVVERGGRVVVVDPRRTETARQFEHVPIRPGTDAWLLLGLLNVVIQEGLIDTAFCAAHVDGLARLTLLAKQFDLDRCAAETGIPVEVIRDIGRSFGRARAAAGYGRFGLCTQRFRTLNNLLLNALNVVTGNVNKPGGVMFGNGAVDFQRLARAMGASEHGAVRSRTLGLPMSIGWLPSQSLWRDITEPGPDRIRSLIMHGANPVLSSGAGGHRLAHALEQLDLFVSLDLYMNETNKHAHYLLPGTTFYERADVPILALELELRPTLYASDRVAQPRVGVREEWEVLNEIAKRMGLGGAYSVKPLRVLAKLGVTVHPKTLLDAAIRTGPHGDWFGLRRGWSVAKLRAKAPHGVKLADHLAPYPDLGKVLRTPNGRIRLVPDELLGEVDRMLAHRPDEAFPMRAIGLRELKSHNSWMHNAPRLTADDRVPAVLVHPNDAARIGLEAAKGQHVRIESATGSNVMAARITDEMTEGVVAVPHGWGHAGGWRRANAAGGSSANELSSADPEDIERLAGMSILSGIPVRITVPADAKLTDGSQPDHGRAVLEIRSSA